MCGRYRLSRRKQFVEEYFEASRDDDWSPRYNIAPTQPIPVIRQHPKESSRVLSLMRWGLIPSWAKDISGATGMINARSETAALKPAFRDQSDFADALCRQTAFTNGRDQARRSSPFASRSITASCLGLRACGIAGETPAESGFGPAPSSRPGPTP
jgi:putative SOS response-associated peptidase YedK